MIWSNAFTVPPAPTNLKHPIVSMFITTDNKTGFIVYLPGFTQGIRADDALAAEMVIRDFKHVTKRNQEGWQ